MSCCSSVYFVMVFLYVAVTMVGGDFFLYVVVVVHVAVTLLVVVGITLLWYSCV